MLFKTFSAVAASALLMISAGASADLVQQKLKEDKEHVQSWNEFADDLMKLHEELVEEREVEKTTELGGYAGQPKFYKEVEYHDAESGKLISRIQWERENPDNVHAIEVYLRDDKDRVKVDFAAAYLPHGRNAPVQTLINVHNYNKGLHAWRQFDASGERIHEYCAGKYQGRDVQLRMFARDLGSSSPQTQKIMSSDVYKACFQGVRKSAGDYLDPYSE